MKKNYWIVVGGGVLLLGISFVVGLVFVMPNDKSLMESLPVVGKWVAERRAMKRPVVDEAVLTRAFEQGGIKKGIGDDGAVEYLVKGRLLEDALVRADGLIQGKVIVDGHLQSQPLTFLAGALNGNLQGGEYNL